MRGLQVIFLNVFHSIIVIAVTSIAFWLDRFIPFQLPFGFTFLAWPLLILGGLLIFWAGFAALVRHSGASGAPGDPTKKLVTTGPYAWLRNPIYAGDALLILGLALLMR
jgi:protein-S-isoprenylcysteine O-methyltransferase Ste14